jgi:hypothetical protein
VLNGFRPLPPGPEEGAPATPGPRAVSPLPRLDLSGITGTAAAPAPTPGGDKGASGPTLVAQLNFVDLAGSERIKTVRRGAVLFSSSTFLSFFPFLLPILCLYCVSN